MGDKEGSTIKERLEKKVHIQPYGHSASNSNHFIPYSLQYVSREIDRLDPKNEFYDKAPLSEIVLHIATERAEQYKEGRWYLKLTAQSLGIKRSTLISWLSEHSNPYSLGYTRAAMVGLSYQGEKPKISLDSFYGRSRLSEIVQCVVAQRVNLLQDVNAAAESLKFPVKHVQRYLEDFKGAYVAQPTLNDRIKTSDAQTQNPIGTNSSNGEIPSNDKNDVGLARGHFHRTKLRTLKSALGALGFSSAQLKDLNKRETHELEATVKTIWKQRSFKLHPDRIDGDVEAFMHLTYAYSRVKRLLPRHHARTHQDMWVEAQRTNAIF